MSETKVYLLDGGSLVIDGFHMYWNRGPAGDVRFPCYSVLIDHPEGKFLFDTGYDKAHVEKVLPFEKPIQSHDQTIPGQLALLGIRPEEITHVINSHFHFDHCGGNKFCTNATTVCHKRELEAAKHPQPFEHLGYSDLSFFGQTEAVKTPAGGQEQIGGTSMARFEPIEGDQEIAKGLWLFETPGHTAGHYSLMVGFSGRRPILFPADAVCSEKNLEMNCICSFHLDPAAGIQSMQRLRELVEKHNAEFFYSHDPDSYPAYKKAPTYYS
jgi:4-pyridoxolactonase